MSERTTVFARTAICLIIVVSLSSACVFTHQPPPPAPARWQCDPSIDALVESGQWEQALTGHEQLLQDMPDNCLAIYHMGYIWGHLGERLEEVRTYERAIACGYTHDDHLFFNLGMAHSDLGNLQRAIEALERAVTLNADNADNFFGLALLLVTAEQAAEAEQALLRALSIDPRHLDAWLVMVRLCLDQSRWEDARGHLDSAAAIDPGNEELQALRQVLKSRQAADYVR